MPSSSDGSSSRIVAVAERHHRVERALTASLALLLALSAAAVIIAYSVGIGVLGGVTAAGALRLPLVKTGGTARLRTDEEPASVAAEFAGMTPPILALQWGIADRVRSTESGAVYDISYLFGLRTGQITTTVDRMAADDAPVDDIRLTLGMNGNAWGTYHIAIHEDEEETLATVKWTSDRRFGLLRLPQWLLARSYRPTTLTLQGYRVDSYASSLSV